MKGHASLESVALDANTKSFIACIPWVLPLHLVLPFAFIASGFRGLLWVWNTTYLPFWGMFLFLSLLATASSVLLFHLQSMGNTLFRVGLGAACLQTTWVAMAEQIGRAHV